MRRKREERKNVRRKCVKGEVWCERGKRVTEDEEMKMRRKLKMMKRWKKKVGGGVDEDGV